MESVSQFADGGPKKSCMHEATNNSYPLNFNQLILQFIFSPDRFSQVFDMSS